MNPEESQSREGTGYDLTVCLRVLHFLTFQKLRSLDRHVWMPTGQLSSSEGINIIQRLLRPGRHRHACLQQDRQRHRQQQEVNPDALLFKQPSVSSKMINLHSKLVSLEFKATSVLPVSSISLILLCPLTGLSAHSCGRDKHIPKLYSESWCFTNIHSYPYSLQTCTKRSCKGQPCRSSSAPCMYNNYVVVMGMVNVYTSATLYILINVQFTCTVHNFTNTQALIPGLTILICI